MLPDKITIFCLYLIHKAYLSTLNNVNLSILLYDNRSKQR